MNNLSFYSNSARTIAIILLCVVSAWSIYGCYSFTGASVPDHLKTVSISNTVDNSGFGVQLYREECTRLLIQKFRNDNSFSLIERKGDAQISSTILSIREEQLNVRVGEVERERKVTVTVEAEYYDAVKKRSVWKKSFAQFSVFQVANAVAERDAAIKKAIDKVTDDILLAVISGW